jgi:hypothetical protein
MVLPRPLTMPIEMKVMNENIKRYSIKACPEDVARMLFLDFII